MTACNTDYRIEQSAVLEELPSGSSIEIWNDQILLIGDDATNVVVLDDIYNIIDSVSIDSSGRRRIPKDEKPDFECSTIIDLNDSKQLFVIGSGSAEKRNVGLLIPLPVSNKVTPQVVDLLPFLSKLKGLGIAEVNIEGAATIDQFILLANRANLTHPTNQFIITEQTLALQPAAATARIIDVKLPQGKVIGISGCTYVAAYDMLFFTASTEETTDSYSDGAIGDSYIGIIYNMKNQLTASAVTPAIFINLVEMDKRLDRQKIEGIAVEKIEAKNAIVHLVADNDDGKSRLFKISLPLEKGAQK